MKSDYQSEQDSGGINPTMTGQTTKQGEGTTANEGVSAKRCVSDSGHAKSRSVGGGFDGDASIVRSGASSIDPGGSRYSSRKSSSDQD